MAWKITKDEPANMHHFVELEGAGTNECFAIRAACRYFLEDFIAFHSSISPLQHYKVSYFPAHYFEKKKKHYIPEVANVSTSLP